MCQGEEMMLVRNRGGLDGSNERRIGFVEVVLWQLGGVGQCSIACKVKA